MLQSERTGRYARRAVRDRAVAVSKISREIGRSVPFHHSLHLGGVFRPASRAFDIGQMNRISGIQRNRILHGQVSGRSQQGSEMPSRRSSPNADTTRIDVVLLGMGAQIADGQFHVLNLGRVRRFGG